MKGEVTLSHISTLVFVGTFPDNMFDERDLFEGRIDPGYVRAGPIIQCSYASGEYQFRVTPDRVDLMARGSDIVSEALVEAAQLIVGQIDAAGRVAPVSGFGMNCDTTFPRHLIGAAGTDYCASLLAPRVRTIVGEESFNPMARVQFSRGPFRYDVRIEPHVQSRGENLYVAVNGHQAVGQGDLLVSKFEPTDTFRSFVKELHQRITAHGIT